MDAVMAFLANGEATKPAEPGERALTTQRNTPRPLHEDVRRRPEIATNAAGSDGITKWLRIVASPAGHRPSARPPAARRAHRSRRGVPCGDRLGSI